MMITIRVRYAYCFLDIGLNIGKIKKEKKEEKKKRKMPTTFHILEKPEFCQKRVQ